MAEVVEALSKLEEMSKYACPHEGCDYRPSPGPRPQRSLDYHIANLHTFVPKACEHSCDPEKLLRKSAYETHLRRYCSTSPNWPAQCAFPGCTCLTTFSTYILLKTHLRDTHNLESFAQIGEYYPPPKPTPTYRNNEPCWIDNCGVIRKH
jgi:hypothetical protein